MPGTKCFVAVFQTVKLALSYTRMPRTRLYHYSTEYCTEENEEDYYYNPNIIMVFSNANSAE